MSIENIYINEPTMDEVYEWHKEEASQSSWTKAVVHLTGAALLWFPLVNQVVYAVSKGYVPKKFPDNPYIKRPVIDYLMHPVFAEKLNNLESIISEQVIGQDEAVHAVCNAIRRSTLRLNTNRPRGSFMFLGPTGVGKTELAKAISDNWINQNKMLHRFDMSEYKSVYALSSLIGAPPGLVGYYNGGALTNALIKDPNGVFLFDEIEKAHPEILDIMLQIFDDGRITDASGQIIDCSKALFIMTSNVGGIAYSLPKEERQPVLDLALRSTFRPEFINRIDEVLYFNALDDMAVFKKIATSKIHLFKTAMEQSLLNRVTISWDESVIDYLAHEGISPEFGARPLERLIQKKLQTLVMNAVLNQCILEGSKLHFTAKDNQIILEVEEPTFCIEPSAPQT